MAGEAMMGAWALAALLQAAPAPPRTADVVVTAGPRPPAEVTRKRVRAITRHSGEQVARFADPVCAGALGLPEPYAARVATRIMADAQTAGVPVGKPGRRPNITVVIVDDGKRLLSEPYRRKPALFSAVPGHAGRDALVERGPARVVSVTHLLSRDGNRSFGDQSGSNTPNPLNSAPVLRVDTDGAPRGLTSFDAAFLKGLYHVPATLRYVMKVTDMTRQIVRQGE